MSLINNALKKAQRQRSGDGAPLVPGGSGGPARRGSSSMPNLALVIGGAVVLVAVSVGLTVYLVRGPDLSRPSSESDGGTAIASQPTASPEIPAVVAPVAIETPPVLVAAEPSPIVALPTAAPSPTATVASEPSIDLPSTVAEPTVPPSTVAEPTVLPSVAPPPSEAVYAYLDKLQVMGIRSSGSDSKVLMNDRVYRVNDIVDRALMLKLTKVTPDSLTFVDANGVSYTKSF